MAIDAHLGVPAFAKEAGACDGKASSGAEEGRITVSAPAAARDYYFRAVAGRTAQDAAGEVRGDPDALPLLASLRDAAAVVTR